MRLNFISIFGAITTVGTQIAVQVIQAMEDDILDGGELTRIFKTAIMGLRMAGVSHEDLDKIQMATSRMDFEMLEAVFKEGDTLVYCPKEVTDKLKIKV
jgi:hypothetical protein